MLALELEGRKYSKAAHRKALLQSLPHRSASAVEYKHCNISAVLQEKGLFYIPGYQPRGNYQDLLAEIIGEHLAGNRDLHRAVVGIDLAPVDSPPDGALFRFADIEDEPPSSYPTTSAKRRARCVDVDWATVTAESRRLGEQGERFVRDMELRRLHDAGRADLAARVEWVAETCGDGLGYDIRSYDEDGSEVFIEVKTTRRPATSRFFISENERRCSAEYGEAYRLYRVFNFGCAPRLFRLKGPLDLVLDLEPTTYSAACKPSRPLVPRPGANERRRESPTDG
jgi:hypothetical protein